MNITNDVQLKSALLFIAKKVITKVSEDIVDKKITRPDQYEYLSESAISPGMGLLQRMIWEKTYKYDYFPNIVYYSENIESGERGNAMPTFQFFRAFKWKNIDVGTDMVKRELFYDWASMQQNPKTGLHANMKRGDLRDELADILNQDYSAVGEKSRKPFWDITINELFNNNLLKYYFDEILVKYGALEIFGNS